MARHGWISQLILLLILKGVDEGDMINFLQTLGVSRENLATSSIIQIVNHGISFGDSVNDESMTGKKPISLAMFCLLIHKIGFVIPRLPGQNGIWIWNYHLVKSGLELKKKIEIPHWGKSFYVTEDFCPKLQIQNASITFFLMEGFQKN